jgi:hypothetical protein
VKLREVQRLLWRAVSWPTGVADFLAQADAATRAQFEEVFADTPHFGRVARVDVYAQSYYWRLEDVLREQFRVTAWLAGDVAFHDLCTDFVLAHPSSGADVRRWATGFCDFVADHVLSQSIVGLPDVARIEWAAVLAIDAPDTRVCTEADLAAIGVPQWPAMVLRAAEHVALCPTRLPYARLWNAREAGEPSPVSPPAPLKSPRHVLVWRQGLEVFHRTVAEDEVPAVRALASGVSFEALVALAGEPPAAVAWLRRWLRDELLAG